MRSFPKARGTRKEGHSGDSRSCRRMGDLLGMDRSTDGDRKRGGSRRCCVADEDVFRWLFLCLV